MKPKTPNDESLVEIWENAIFDDASYEVFEKTVTEKLKGKKHASSLDEPYSNIPEKELAFELSTIRNRNLITIDEQNVLRKTVVGFFGLSVGSHAALTWMMESRADSIKIMDHDTIASTNLNRLRFGWNDLGRKKVDVVKEHLLEINPYVTVILSTNTSISEVENFFNSEPKLSVVVDAIDDMNGKIYLRKLAKERKIPLVSAADVGDNVVLDIERYDLTPQPELFLGRIPNIENIDFSKLSDIERKKLIIHLVEFEQNSEKLLDSLLSIGKNLATWPQLGATATVAGGVVTTVIKKIVLGEKIKSGRYYISLDTILVSDFNDENRKKHRGEKIHRLKKRLEL